MMARFYVMRIRAGKMTIGDVPTMWRAEVERILGA